MSKRDLSPDSLEAQADALLAAADSMDIPDEIPMPGKSSRSGKAAKAARPEADHGIARKAAHAVRHEGVGEYRTQVQLRHALTQLTEGIGKHVVRDLAGVAQQLNLLGGLDEMQESVAEEHADRHQHGAHHRA